MHCSCLAQTEFESHHPRSIIHASSPAFPQAAAISLPTQADGQFCDRGDHYRTAIFTSDPDEIAAAERSRTQAAEALSAKIVTPILPSVTFWVAEAYHQDFYKKNPARYNSYRTGCGRDQRLQALWGDKAGH